MASKRSQLFVAISALALLASPAIADTYTYDALGRLSTSATPAGVVTTYAYDAAGNRTSVVTTSTYPFANPDAVTTAYNTATTLDPRTNDTDPGGRALTISAVGSPTHGTTSFTGTSVTYTPTSGYSGADSFPYTISNGIGTASSTVSVTVASAAPPIAHADTMSVGYNGSQTIDPRTNDSDPTGHALSVTAVGAPSHGSASFTASSVSYTATSGYNGSDSFSYTISNGIGGTASANVAVTVANPPPPVANNDSITVPYNSVYTFDPRTNDTDPTGHALTVTYYGSASHGSVSRTSTSLTYTPNSGFSGSDSFTYTISNGAGGTSTATVSVTVSPHQTLTASVSPTTWQSDQEGHSTTADPPVTASGVNGTPGYSYSWTRVSGSTFVSAYSPSYASTSFYEPTLHIGTYSAVYKCTVTDNSSATATTANVSVTITYNPNP